MTPFVGSSNPTTTFTPDHQVFEGGEPYKPVDDDNQFRALSNKKWTVNNPNKKGHYGTFTEFPNYIEEGEKSKKPVKH